jgi:hypothetical protein
VGLGRVHQREVVLIGLVQPWPAPRTSRAQGSVLAAFSRIPFLPCCRELVPAGCRTRVAYDTCILPSPWYGKSIYTTAGFQTLGLQRGAII